MSQPTAHTLFHQLHQCMSLLHRGHGHGHGGHHGAHQCRQHHGVHHGQGRVLHLLIEQDGLSQRELTEKLHVRASSLSEVLDKLSAEGFIERRSHPEDGRISTVHITNKGRKFFTGVHASHTQAMEELLVDFSEEEKGQLSGLLVKLIRSLKARSEGMEEEQRCCISRQLR